MTLQKMNDYISQFPQLSVEESILGLQEAITKLWVATKHKDKTEEAKRLANIIIGVSFAAKSLMITDLDNTLDRRMIEFQDEMKGNI